MALAAPSVRQSPNTFGSALAYSLLYVLSVGHGGRELLVSRDEQLRHMLQEVLIVGENHVVQVEFVG